jgi:membrane-associated phospholipid phosphatase
MNKSSNILILISGLLAPAAAILSVCAGVFDYFPGDLWMSQTVQSLANPGLTGFFKGVSWIFGDWHVIILVIPAWLLVWWKAGFTEGLLVPLASIISVTNEGLKIVIARPRPAPDLVNVMMPYHSSSFPSGHIFFAVMFIGILTFLFFKHIKTTVWRGTILTSVILIILIIALARIYLGLHWASDILGGLVYGLLLLFLLIELAPGIISKNLPSKTN